MAKSVNFEPLINLVNAFACGSQISSKELLAYDYACDYYGEARVALQKTIQEVEGAEPYTERERRAHMRHYTVDRMDWNNLEINRIVSTFIVPYERSIYSIFIHWPQVTVTNENDQSIDLKDLFARVPLSLNGMSFPEYERFTFMKTTYTRAQWNHAYMHSHVQTISLSRPFIFKHVCLGTGPIRNTINTLVRHPDNEEAMMLFFWELDKVAHVESLAGVPYNRLANVTGEELSEVSFITDRYDGIFNRIKNGPNKVAFRDFMSSFFRSENIPMGFRGGQYVLGCSFLEFAILLTNYYKKWRDAYDKAVQFGCDIRYTAPFSLHSYLVKDNKLWEGSARLNNRSVPRVPDFKFKDKFFALTVEDSAAMESYLKCELISVQVVAAILNFILTTINTATSTYYEEKSKKESDFWNEQYLLSVSGSPSGRSEGFAQGNTATAY